MDKFTAHSAALKLINDLAIVDSDIAAKIKPSIDMFVESLDNLSINNNFWSDLEEYFTISKDKRKEWLKNHEMFAKQVYELYDSMQKKDITINEVKEIKNGVPTSDIPIKGDEQPESEISAQIPEDGFKNDAITYPTKIDGDDKRFFGKTEKDLPTQKEMDPNNKPKVIDGNEGQAEVVKTPNPTNRPAQIALNYESARKFFESYIQNEEKKKISEKSKLVKEAMSDDDKYVIFLNNLQKELSSENYDKFIPIRKYASRLFKEFPNDFDKNYDAAKTVAQEWYDLYGKNNRKAKKIIPSNIYVELRRGSDSNFVVNLYLLKIGELTEDDKELAIDIYSTYTDNYVDDKLNLWKKLSKPVRTVNGLASAWVMTIPLSKENKKNFVLSRIKHDIANNINYDYKNKFVASTRIPGWVYSQTPMESLNEDKNVDYKDVYKKVINQIFQYDEFEDGDDNFDEEKAKAYILKRIPEKLEYYCDVMDIDFMEASNALDEKEIEDLVDDYLFRIDTFELNESANFRELDYMPDYKVVNIIVQRLWQEYLRRNGLNVINFKDEDALEYIIKHFKYDINKYCEEYEIDASQFDSITDKDIKIVFDKMLELYDL